jgi:predicted nucleotidyltransferase
MELSRQGWTKEDITQVLQRGNPKELLSVPIVVSMNVDDDDREWAENICIALANHSDFNVRGNAILGFGHIARICETLSTEKILPLVEKALKDEHEFVRGQAEAAVIDIEFFLKISVRK